MNNSHQQQQQQQQQQMHMQAHQGGHMQSQVDGSGDARTRMRAVRAAAPSFMQHHPNAHMQQQKMMGQQSQEGLMQASIFGKQVKGWADHLADEEALHSNLNQNHAHMHGHPTPHAIHPNNHAHMMHGQGIMPMALRSRSSQFVLPNPLASKPPSPIDASGVKFVNSTIENLQSQIKKEEAPKKKRTRTSPEQLRILQKAFNSDPMPSSQARSALSKKLGMNPRAVQVWFQNRRAKAKRAEALGLSPNGEDDCASMSGSEDELVHEMQNFPPQYRQMQKGGNMRAASMSSAMPMNGYHLDNGYFGLHPNHADGTGYYDSSNFMDSVATSFDSDLALPSLDFSAPGMYNNQFSFPAPAYSLPNSAYDIGVAQPHDLLRTMYGGPINTVPEDTNLTEDVMRHFDENSGVGSVDHGLGPINPLSAFMDAQVMESNRLREERGPISNLSPCSSASSGAGLGRRSYSLNDIHAHLTKQQIQTLESIGLPALGPGASTSGLSCIREEECSAGQEAANTSRSGSSMDPSAEQDQLLTTIDDLRMGAFWEASM